MRYSIPIRVIIIIFLPLLTPIDLTIITITIIIVQFPFDLLLSSTLNYYVILDLFANPINYFYLLILLLLLIPIIPCYFPIRLFIDHFIIIIPPIKFTFILSLPLIIIILLLIFSLPSSLLSPFNPPTSLLTFLLTFTTIRSIL